jgi:hypothetical protein
MFIERLIKAMALSLIFILLPELSFAKVVPGYIINNTSDTIYGFVKIEYYNLRKTNFSFSLFNYHDDILYYQLFFKKDKDKKYQTYNPEDILEYGFELKQTHYRFISTEVKTIMSNKNKHYFYKQLVKGEIELYKSKIIQNNVGLKDSDGIPLIELFVKNKENILIKVSKINNSESLSDFLYRTTNADKAILEKVAANKSFNDIIEVVVLYNHYFEEKISI